MKWKIERVLFKDDTGLNFRGNVMNSIDREKQGVDLQFHEHGLWIEAPAKAGKEAYGALVASAQTRIWYCSAEEEKKPK